MTNQGFIIRNIKPLGKKGVRFEANGWAMQPNEEGGELIGWEPDQAPRSRPGSLKQGPRGIYPLPIIIEDIGEDDE